MTDIDPREDRLPVWAQRELALLRQRLRDAEKARDAARLATDPDSSSAIIDDYVNTPIGLGEQARVTFKAADLNVQVYVDEWGRLLLQGSESFAVLPQASNVISIVPRRPL